MDGEIYGRGEGGRHLPDRSGRLDRFLGRMVRLVVRTGWGLVKLVVRGAWRLLRPSRDPATKRARTDRPR
jgi:hypothetical protein